MVYKRILKMVDYGDACHRKRLVLVGFKRTFPGAHECIWEKPAPRFHAERPHCVRDIACDDADVHEEDKRTQPLHVVYEDDIVPVPAAVFGEIQKLGRLYLGYAMGPGHNPYLFAGWDGSKTGPTTHGGGGTYPGSFRLGSRY